MAAVYILYSKTADLFYIGYTKDLLARMDYHLNKEFQNSFTAKHTDWELYFSIDELTISTAIKIEKHIKKMKSSTYLKNLKNIFGNQSKINYEIFFLIK